MQYTHYLLKNASKKHDYDLRVMYTNISKTNQEKLSVLVSWFPNASLSFHRVDTAGMPVKVAGWSQEIIYKLIVANMFADIDKAIVTDVDVVFVGDISTEFMNFTSDDYFAGVKQAALPTDKMFSTNINDDNVHFMYGAGYMIYNLKKMRQDNMPAKYIDFMQKNIAKLKLPDQEILNIVSFPKIKELHPRNMALVTWWRVQDFVFNKYDYASTAQEHKEAIQSPVQLHYVGYKTWGKPWSDPSAPCAEIWFRYLTCTNFFDEYYSGLFGKLKTLNNKKKKFWKIFK